MRPGSCVAADGYPLPFVAASFGLVVSTRLLHGLEQRPQLPEAASGARRPRNLVVTRAPNALAALGQTSVSLPPPRRFRRGGILGRPFLAPLLDAAPGAGRLSAHAFWALGQGAGERHEARARADRHGGR